MTNTRQRMTNAERDAVDAAILEIARRERPITVRGLFYRVMSRGLVPKSEAGYKVVQREALKLRRNGELSYGWITDGSRRRLTLKAYSGLDQALTQTAQFYRRRLWNDQNVYVEVWTEKDAITGVVQQTALSNDVPLVVAKGYVSETFLWEGAEEITEVGKPTFIYQLGDHDRDGVQAFEKIQQKLRDFVPDDIPITFERIAVTPSQIEELGLPTRPDKTDSGFGPCVEVDAIDSNTLRNLVRAAITQHFDQDALRITEAAERSEREILEAIAGEHSNGEQHSETERQARKLKREKQLQQRNAQREAQRKHDKALAALRKIEDKLAE